MDSYGGDRSPLARRREQKLLRKITGVHPLNEEKGRCSIGTSIRRRENGGAYRLLNFFYSWGGKLEECINVAPEL